MPHEPSHERRQGLLMGRAWRSPLKRSESAVTQNSSVSLDGSNGATPSDSDCVVARAGDLVIVQERYDQLVPLVLTGNGVLHNRYGRFRHSDVIGHRLGMRWDSIEASLSGTKVRGGRGFVYVLAPNPALWSLAMLHRTQVVYPHDSAIIALFLELRPGSILVECGTGAGSAAIAFGRIVAPHGRVLSFEFHRERAAAACADIKALGLADVVHVTAGHDVLAEGFAGVADGSVDAVFLDLPAPYNVVREAARVLRRDGTICSFSPCIEQVQRTCEELSQGVFHSVRTVTAPVRTYETRVDYREAPGFDKLASGSDGVWLAGEKGLDEAGRAASCGGNVSSRPDSGPGSDSGAADAGDEDSWEQAAPRKKRKRLGGRSLASERMAVYRATRMGVDGEPNAAGGAELAGHVVRPPVPVKSRAFAEMKGHTSYLTFARRGKGGLPGKDQRGLLNGLAGVPKLPGGLGGGTGCRTM